MDFRKTFYILPNLFTLLSVVCGFASLALSAAGRGQTDFYLAGLAICFGFFFDTFDGRVARLTRTQTELGRDLDSLADIVTFGAAPALMVYKWGLTSFGRMGIFIAGCFVAAAAMRLARFNVLSRREEAAGKVTTPGKYILGLTVPVAAGVLVFMVMVSHNTPGDLRLVSEGSTAAIVLVLSFLMVSRVRFRSFKDVRMTRKTIGFILLLSGVVAAIAYSGLEKAAIFLFLLVAYIALGFAEEIIYFKSRRLERRAKKAAKCAKTEGAGLRTPLNTSQSLAQNAYKDPSQGPSGNVDTDENETGKSALTTVGSGGTSVGEAEEHAVLEELGAFEPDASHKA